MEQTFIQKSFKRQRTTTKKLLLISPAFKQLFCLYEYLRYCEVKTNLIVDDHVSGKSTVASTYIRYSSNIIIRLISVVGVGLCGVLFSRTSSK